MRDPIRGHPAALRGRRAISGLFLLLGLAGVLLHGCRDELGTELDTNLPPDTYLTGAPAESTTNFYQVHFHWYGNDADGRVVRFEYAITDSFPADEDTITFHPTTRTDSVFTFRVGAGQQVLGHRFYIRAIDNEGAVDETPAWRFFGAIDLNPPQPIFTLAEAFDPEDPAEVLALTSTHPTVPTDTVPDGWNVRFRWRGEDADRMINEFGDTVTVGEIREYEYWLIPHEVAPNIVDTTVTAVSYSGLKSQTYRFSLRAIDDAGFRGLDAEERTFVWNRDPQTYFVAAKDTLDPATGDSLLSYFASSAAWEGEREFFVGDTVPLMRGATGSVQPVTIRVDVWGRDPDDQEGAGVNRFQRRLSSQRWKPLLQPRRIELGNQRNLNADLQVRCADSHGRPDGSPPTLRIAINQSPQLLREFADEQGEPTLQYPQPGQIIPIATIRNAGWRLRAVVKATDPDSTTDTFSYRFKMSSEFLLSSGPECENLEDVPCRFLVPFPTRLAEGLGSTPREVALIVRIIEQARGVSDQHLIERSIPFYIVDE